MASVHGRQVSKMASVHLSPDAFPAVPPLALAGLLAALRPRLLQPRPPEAVGECSPWVVRVQQPQPTSPSHLFGPGLYEPSAEVCQEETILAQNVVRPEAVVESTNVVRPEEETILAQNVVRPEAVVESTNVVRPVVDELEGVRPDIVDQTKLELQLPECTRPRESDPGPPTLERAATAPAGPREQVVQPEQKPVTCDKCDGPHETDACPHFRKVREQHKDAWVNYGRLRPPAGLGGSGGNFVLKGGKCVPQPGDGSCLFHSLCFGLNGGSSGSQHARKLRTELATFIERNPSLEIAGDTIEEWVGWDANTTVSSYARRMAVSGWGGGIEMAACSLLKKVNVHVYERRWLGGHKRISCFDYPEPTDKTIHVLYRGSMHYDALVPP